MTEFINFKFRFIRKDNIRIDTHLIKFDKPNKHNL